MAYRNPFLGNLGMRASMTTMMMRDDPFVSEPVYVPPPTVSTASPATNTNSTNASGATAAQAATQAVQLLQPTADARTLMLNSPNGLVYPAANGTTVLLTYVVPSGSVLVVQSLAIVNVGPDVIDYSGNAIFHVLRNGAGIRGYANLLAQLGTLAQPQGGMNMVFEENQALSITVSVPAGKAVPAGNVPAARMFGYLKLAPQRTNIFPRK